MLDDEVSHGRQTLGVIDGALTQVALAAVLLVPTIASVLFGPNLLTSQIDDIQDHGYRGAILAPGPLFALGFLSLLMAASFSPSGGAMIALGENVFSATTEGQFWKAASLIAPLFLVAIALGLIFLVSAVIWRLRRQSLEASLRTGLYALFGIACVLIAGEPISTLIAPGGSNNVAEPVLVTLVASWMTFFHLRAFTGPSEPIIRRIGAALTTAVLSATAIALSYVI